MFKINKAALKCYNCGAKFSVWEKFFLNSRNSYSIHCKKCGKVNKLPKWANLNYFINTFLFIIPLAFFKPSLTVVFISLGVYCLITSIITIFFIPLTDKK